MSGKGLAAIFLILWVPVSGLLIQSLRHRNSDLEQRNLEQEVALIQSRNQLYQEREAREERGARLEQSRRNIEEFEETLHEVCELNPDFGAMRISPELYRRLCGAGAQDGGGPAQP